MVGSSPRRSWAGGYSVPVLHRTVRHDQGCLRRPPAPVRLGLAAVLASGVLLTASACSSSAPATLAPTATEAMPSASPTETLLAESADTYSAVGALVEGFPSDLVPVPEGAEVLVSAAEPVDGSDLVEISLNLRSAQDAPGLLEAVRAPLVAAGFTEAPVGTPEAGLAAQSTFSRSDGTELLVVGVLDRDGERTLTLGGQVRTGS
ncbi:hypothetical protein GCM10022273_33790 [Cellulomonas soli]